MTAGVDTTAPLVPNRVTTPEADTMLMPLLRGGRGKEGEEEAAHEAQSCAAINPYTSRGNAPVVADICCAIRRQAH